MTLYEDTFKMKYWPMTRKWLQLGDFKIKQINTKIYQTLILRYVFIWTWIVTTDKLWYIDLFWNDFSCCALIFWSTLTKLDNSGSDMLLYNPTKAIIYSFFSNMYYRTLENIGKRQLMSHPYLHNFWHSGYILIEIAKLKYLLFNYPPAMSQLSKLTFEE